MASLLKSSLCLLVSQNFFSSVSTHEPHKEIPFFEERKFKEKLENMNITLDMVRKKLVKSKINQSPLPDKVHPRVLKEIADTISILITIILNTSIRTTKLP